MSSYYVLLLLSLFGSFVSTFPFTTPRHPVIMISFDGFRHDYLEMVKARGLKTPHFDMLIANGVKAKYMKNAFITKTFPNHYTLATGMYEESHGVVSNNMFDPKYNETFTLAISDKPSDELNKWFTNDTTAPDQGPEPIWVTNQKGEQSGQARKSGVVMWPGSTAKVHGFLPEKLLPYNRSVPDETRVDTIIDWLTAAVDPINLGLLYFSEPDHTGHQAGPNSEEVAEVIVKLDGVLGYLIDSLKNHHLFDKVNIIVTSDHGMSEIRNITVVEDYGITPDMYAAYGSTPILSVMPQGDETVDSLFEKLKKVEHLTVYKKGDETADIPRKYFYTYNRRILPLLIVADDHWQICAVKDCHLTRGNHGFSNENDNMHPIFFAHGPSFKQNVTVPPFDNVNVYPLLCNLLGITPGPNNGSVTATVDMLENERSLSVTGITFFVAVIFAACVSGIICISVLRNNRSHRLRKPLKTNSIPGEDSPLNPGGGSVVTSEEELA